MGTDKSIKGHDQWPRPSITDVKRALGKLVSQYYEDFNRVSLQNKIYLDYCLFHYNSLQLQLLQTRNFLQIKYISCLQGDMSDDELEDWSVVVQDDWTVAKPAAEILRINAERVDRLNGYMKNQYCRTVVQVNFKNLVFSVQYKMVQKHTWHIVKMYFCISN